MFNSLSTTAYNVPAAEQYRLNIDFHRTADTILMVISLVKFELNSKILSPTDEISSKTVVIHLT